MVGPGRDLDKGGVLGQGWSL